MLDVVRVAPPKIRPKRMLTLDDNASSADRMQWILSGGMQRKKDGPIAGNPEGLADGVLRFLEGEVSSPGSQTGIFSHELFHASGAAMGGSPNFDTLFLTTPLLSGYYV